MHYKDPNRPESVKDPRPKKRYYKSNTGDAAVDGYSVYKKRPRVKGMRDWMEPDEADRYDRIFGVGEDE